MVVKYVGCIIGNQLQWNQVLNYCNLMYGKDRKVMNLTFSNRFKKTFE